MKKVSYLFVAVFAFAMVLTSCGGAATTEATDSTAVEEVAPAADVAADTAAVAVDSTQAQ